MDFMSVVDDFYFLPPASVRDLKVGYENFNLKDIWENEESTFPKDKTGNTPANDKAGNTPAINMKIKSGTEVQNCSLWEKDSNVGSTRNDQFSQTFFIENSETSASELLCDNFQDENNVFCNPKMNNSSDNANAEHTFKKISTETVNTSGESNEAIKETSFKEISNEKIKNNILSNLNNKLYQHKENLLRNALQRLTKISDLSNNSHNSTENPLKTTTKICSNCLTTCLCKNPQKKENDIEKENVPKSVSPPLSVNLLKEKNDTEIGNVQRTKSISLKIDTKRLYNNPITENNHVDNETTPCFIQSEIIDSSLKMFESKEEELNYLNSTNIKNVQKNSKRNFENSSMEDISTNESFKMFKLCDDKDHKNNNKIDKDFINQCLKNWNKNFPWASLEENSWIVGCKVCSYYTSKPLNLCHIKTSCDIYSVAKYLRNHNSLQKHRFLNFFGRFDIFQKVYETLRGISKTFPSKCVLYENIKCIVKSYNGSSVDGPDINFLIHTIASVIKESVISKIRSRMNCGIVFLCDPCRDILIVKYSDYQNYSQQIVITNYTHPETPKEALEKFISPSNFEKGNIIFSKLLSCSNCSNCFSQTPISNESKENTLPLPLPHEFEFLDCMRKNDNIFAFQNFVWNLSIVYNQNPHYFQSLNGHALLKTPEWVLSELNSFVFENYQQLKLILKSRIKFSSTHVDYCKAFNLDTSSSFSTLINAISCIANYLHRRLYSEDIKNELINKIEKYLKILKNNKVFYSANEEAINILSLYYKEILNESYCNGVKNVSDFTFLFEPKRMTELLTCNYKAADHRATLKRTWHIFQRFIPLSVETFSRHLTFFGNHLLKISLKESYYLKDIIHLFNHFPELRRNYPYILRFYRILGTLPFIRRSSNRSMVFISILKSYLQRDFDSNMSNSLLTIVIEESTVTENEINELYQMVLNKVLAL